MTNTGIVKLASVLRKLKHKLKAVWLALRSKERNQSKWESDFVYHAEAVDKMHNPAFGITDGFISDGLHARLIKFIRVEEVINLYDCVEQTGNQTSLLVDQYNAETLAKLDSNISVHGLHLLPPADKLIKELHRELRTLFSRYIGSPFVFVNTRMWSTTPSAERYGPNKMHLDAFQPGHMKIMIYLTPLDEAHGYFEYQGGVVKNDKAGLAVCFCNSDLLHSGVPGTSFDRTCIEVTLMKTLSDGPQLNESHFFGRHLKTPSLAYHLRQQVSAELGIKWKQPKGNLVNIGSGKMAWDGWVCLDELDHQGVQKMTFDPESVLPLETNSVSLFYSSHVLEHCSTETVENLLGEMERALVDDGRILVKIPDFDWFLYQYRNKVKKCVEGVGIDSIVNTWAAKGIADTFENRLAMMFCGYWNIYYGDHFSGKININSKAYHGPPVIDKKLLKNYFLELTPNEISKKLYVEAINDNDFKSFNHQNAWSKEEFTKLLKNNNLDCEEMDKLAILNCYSHLVPDLSFMEDWSAYYLIRKATL